MGGGGQSNLVLEQNGPIFLGKNVSSILGICSSTRGLHDLRKRVFWDVTNKQTDIATLWLNRPIWPIQWKSLLADIISSLVQENHFSNELIRFPTILVGLWAEDLGLLMAKLQVACSFIQKMLTIALQTMCFTTLLCSYDQRRRVHCDKRRWCDCPNLSLTETKVQVT